MSTREKLVPTPGATVGPFFPVAFVEAFPSDLVRVAPPANRPEGQPISVTFHFVDATGKPVPSVIVEVWQANSSGRYCYAQDRSGPALDTHFDGFARLRTDDRGTCTLTTIKPGASKSRASHLRLTIFASGIDRLSTQVFCEGEARNESDPVLNAVDADVRQRLIARRKPAADHEDCLGYELTIVMRGEGETPFFDDEEETE